MKTVKLPSRSRVSVTKMSLIIKRRGPIQERVPSLIPGKKIESVEVIKE
jgi:hypothetical protein